MDGKHPDYWQISTILGESMAKEYEYKIKRNHQNHVDFTIPKRMYYLPALNLKTTQFSRKIGHTSSIWDTLPQTNILVAPEICCLEDSFSFVLGPGLLVGENW